MHIDKNTKIDAVLREYPFLEDFMPSISREYRLLKNPLVRQTVAKVATLERVAAIGKVPIEKLLEQIAARINEVTNEEVLKPANALTREDRRAEVKRIIKEIHAGKNLDEVKREFLTLISSISAPDLAQAEQELIREGLPVAEVQSLCNVHARVFQEGLAQNALPGVPAGHPVQTMLAENREVENRISAIKAAGAKPETICRLVDDLRAIEVHYVRKENQLFPQLERHGITGPSQVMWGKHDEIRKLFKAALSGGCRDQQLVGTLLDEVGSMITKEENILIPMALETLSDAEWGAVKEGERELGYAWINPAEQWSPLENRVDIRQEETAVGELKLAVGHLSPELVNLMLCHLPVEISYVNEFDEVVYYNQTADRIFPRTPAAIGRKVQNCHPQSSVDIVNRILRSFKDGREKSAEFWIESRGKFILIKYLAVRDSAGTYKGCMEVTQDVTAIRALTGERRLLDRR